MKEYDRENLVSVIEHGEANGARIGDPLYIVARILLGIEETLQFFRDEYVNEEAPEKEEAAEEAVARVQGLEKACREIQRFVEVGLSGEEAKGVGSHATHQLVSIAHIVDSCVKYSGEFGDEEAADAET